MNSISAMKQALEALERLKSYGNIFMYRKTERNPYDQAVESITELRQAIEQAEKQEPVAWMMINPSHLPGNRSLHWEPQQWHITWKAVPLYTTPVHASDISQERVDETAKCGRDWVEMQCPCGHKMYVKHTGREWVGLTDEEVGGLTVFDGLTHIEVPILAAFVRVIEAKIKEKNNDRP